MVPGVGFEHENPLTVPLVEGGFCLITSRIAKNSHSCLGAEPAKSSCPRAAFVLNAKPRVWTGRDSPTIVDTIFRPKSQKHASPAQASLSPNQRAMRLDARLCFSSNKAVDG
jgi:hypothetical protein